MAEKTYTVTRGTHTVTVTGAARRDTFIGRGYTESVDKATNADTAAEVSVAPKPARVSPTRKSS